MKTSIRLRMILWMVAFASVLCLVAGLLRFRLDSLFYGYVSSQVSKQAAIMAELVDERVSVQLEFLSGISREMEKDSSRMSVILESYRKENGISYGVLNLKGKLIVGDTSVTVSPADFSSIAQSFRGNEAVSYSGARASFLAFPYTMVETFVMSFIKSIASLKFFAISTIAVMMGNAILRFVMPMIR